MDYTPEQLGAAYKKAIAAGNIPVANEIANALNAAVGQPSASITEPSQEEMAAAQQSLARETRSMEPVTFPEGLQAYFSRDKRNQIAQELSLIHI